MSCIELYRGDLCHFHLLSIENIADFVTCSSMRAVCARVCVCVCVWWFGMMGWTNLFKIKQMDVGVCVGGGGGGGGGGEGAVGERSPHCGQII